MGASELTFESYKSKRTLFFVYIICFSVSGPKVLKNRVCVLPYLIAVKSYRTFSNRILKMCSDRPKIGLGEKMFERKNSQPRFCCSYVKLTTLQI